MKKLSIMVLAAAALCLAGCSHEDNGPTIGDQGAGSTKPGRPGGGTRSTADSGIKANNLDPSSGVTVASRGTTGSVALPPVAGNADASHGAAAH